MRSFAAGFAGAARGAAFAMPGGRSAAAFAVRRASACFYSLFTPSMRALARRAAAFAKETRNAQECERRSV
ncbi:hypothetical protein [Burkholderia pseudomallei]|uniref:hypothetical protein n=1 Tax=Burkholderia pseudomallei TaxID=28450 RepID=UPI0005B91470|nr:hypothetical protein [Burkholderia pseudomallei]MBM5669773.1 hypothetical protein [Burkholderia pseudomallei]OMY91382.1 hypothetical protein AQ854_09970 [Burkholderia pseudomallei]OMY99523.1 hypothetical protein AQ856_04710 [Burkholderia pseudomallei]OMZ05262.1 hypothetical protein AQ855_26315 [Burkholderia pseudomallei]OMZ97333.1 hypothetical protein AQ870_23240 [Burkholderia pseudomallei]